MKREYFQFYLSVVWVPVFAFILFLFNLGVLNAQQVGTIGLGGSCTLNTHCISGNCFVSGNPDDGGFGICIDDIDDYVEPQWPGHCYFLDTFLLDEYDPNYDPDDPGIKNITEPCAVPPFSESTTNPPTHVPVAGCYFGGVNPICATECINGYIPRGVEENEYDDFAATPNSSGTPVPLSACEIQDEICLETNNSSYNTANSTLCPGNETGIQNTSASNRSSVLVGSCPLPDYIVERSPRCQKICNPGYSLTTTFNGKKKCDEIPPTPSLNNVFGWAWSSNIGWLKMSRCDDNDDDGRAYETEGCYNTHYGVRIATNGNMSGYAWNNNIGWIKFGDNASSGGIGNTDANLNIPSGSNIGTFRGWAKFVSGFTGHIFDGWVSFSGSNYLSGVMDGSRGLTYDKSKRLIVGSVWGGNVIGWIKFGDGDETAYPRVTYGVIPEDYSITATPPAPLFHVFSAGESSQGAFSTVSVRRMPGIPAPDEVFLSASFLNSGHSLPNIDISFMNELDCELPCTNQLQIKVYPGTPAGLYSIEIKATPPSGHNVRTTIITFAIPTDADTTDPNFRASCYPVPSSIGRPFYVNQPVTWELKITGAALGHSVFQPVTLTGTSIHVFGQPMTTLSQSATPTIFTSTKTYSTTGVKDANVSVQYTIPPPPASSTTQPIHTTNTVTCTPVTVLAQPSIHEF